MQRSAHPVTRELFSVSEIAAAGRVSVDAVQALLDAGQVVSFRGFVAPSDAAVLVRRLRRGDVELNGDRSPITPLKTARSRQGLPLLGSGLLHGAGLLALVWAAAMGLLANDTEQHVVKPEAAHLVFLVEPGPGGGGGGGGLQMPAPPPQARRASEIPKPALAPPIVRVRRDPPVRSTARLPKPIEPPPVALRPIYRPIDRPIPPVPQVVKAPVAQAAPDPISAPGSLIAKTTADSNGPGSGGGVGIGAGTGLGEGEGSGIGEGSGGGAGGGMYGPGSGVEPPAVIREVRPTYSDEARRRGIEGDVDLQVVVLRDGTVGSVRMVKGLGAGLDQKAVEAVRQWRFRPARRRGLPVEVMVDVSVEFKLR